MGLRAGARTNVTLRFYARTTHVLEYCFHMHTLQVLIKDNDNRISDGDDTGLRISVARHITMC